MLFRNTEQDRAFAFIRDIDFDIFCLQEVPGRFLKRLQTFPFHIEHTIDTERGFSSTERLYLVILSRYPIKNQGVIPFPDYWPLLPLYSRLFIRLMPSRLFSKSRNRGGMYADITIHDVLMRVFNLHLILMQPTWRLKEFELAMVERNPSQPTIVCGDFNIIESPRVSLLNWLHGGSPADTLLYRRERTHIEKRFVAHELVNPLRGETTHSFAGSQLDHILVSHSFSIKNASVLRDRIGSDHHPLRIEVT